MNRQLNIDLQFQDNQLYDPNKKDNYDLSIINTEITNNFDEFQPEDYYDSSNPFDKIRETFSKPGFLPRVDIEEDEIDRDDIIFDISNFNNQSFRVQEDLLNPVFEKGDANEDDLRYASFAKEVYTNLDKRKDIEEYEYIADLSSDKYSTHVGDKEIVFSIKGSDPSGTFVEGTTDIIKDIGIAFSTPSANDSNIFKMAGGVASSIVLPAIGAGLIASGAIASAPLVGTIGGLSALSLIGTGLLYNDLNDFQNQLEKIEKKYPDRKINVTGHSQGGTYANLLGIKNEDYDVYTFNAGRGTPNLYNNIKCKYGDCTNIKNYRIVGDFASSLPDGFTEGKSYNLKPKIPDGQTILESKSAEVSLFIPADLYIPHNIRNFEDRTPNNLMPDYGLYGRTLSRRVTTASAIIGGALGYGGIKASSQLVRDYLPKIGKQLVKLATAKELAKQSKLKSITDRKPTSVYNIDQTFQNKFSKFYEPNISSKQKKIEEISDTVFDNQMKERLKALQKETKPSEFIPYNVKEIPKPPKANKTQLQSNFDQFNNQLNNKFKQINKKNKLYSKLSKQFKNEKKISSIVKNTIADIKSKPKQNIIEKEIKQGINIVEQNIKDSSENFSKLNLAVGGIASGGLAEISGAFSYDSLIKPQLYEDLERF